MRCAISAETVDMNLFSTLSGSCITTVLLNSFDKDGSDGMVLLSFYARRFLRLMLIFYVMLCALVLLDIGALSASWPWHAASLSNIYIAFGGAKTTFWSLAVEEQFLEL